MMNTAFHPQTNGQSERTIQNLEDMLRACVLNHKGSWKQCWKCRYISSTFRVSGLPDTISVNESRMKEKLENIGQNR